MKKLLILILFINYISLSSDWRLVEEFDNTPTWKYSSVQSIHCLDKNNCFALVDHAKVGDAGWQLYISNNQGRTWEIIYKSNVQMSPSVEEAQSPYPGYYFILSNYSTFIEKSTDGGETFRKIILDPDSHYPKNIGMYDTSIGFLTNSNSIYLTKDGWETFERHPKQSSYSPIFLDSNTIAMTSFCKPPLDTQNHMAFVKYHINENSWDTLFYFESEFKVWGDNVTNLFFINDSLGFGCGDRVDFSLPSGQYLDIIYKTTDGGHNWTLIHKEYQYPYKGFYNNISFADDKNGIAVGFYGKIAMTNDGGDTWVYEPYPNDMKNCRKMQVCWAGRTPLIGTWDAGIFRYEGDFFKFPDTTAVEDNLITNYQLLITPNPAEEYIEINFERCPTSVRCRTSEKIEIYNVLGECIKTVPIPSPQAPNPQKVDISELPAGFYIVRIENNFGKFIK
jgi:photosystem II stability/assembly factor-like uncharacterized protein